MQNVTEYTGNAGLGLGGNADIPAIATVDLESLNRTADRLQMQNAAQNQEIFRQKVADRDKLYEALSSGDIKVGAIRDEDRPRMKEALDKLEEAYFKRMKVGVYDPDAHNEYNKRFRDAQDVATQAQLRKVFFDTENLALSKETLPRKQEARKANLDKYFKDDFYKLPTPYQQTLDHDFSKIQKYPQKVTTTKPDPKNRFMNIKETKTDLLSTFLQADKAFKEDREERQDQIGLFESYQQMHPLELKNEIAKFNTRLRPYGKEAEIKFDEETGAINESTPEFAAKWAMAIDPQLSAEESLLDEGKLKVENFKLNQTKEANLNKYRQGQLAIQRDNLSFKKEQARKLNVSEQLGNSAKAYAEGLFEKLTGLADENGNISPEKLKTLTPDELKYLGTGGTTDNKFALTPQSLENVQSARITPEGSLELSRKSERTSLGGTKPTQTKTIDLKQVAGNKLAEEMILTTGKEGVNYNTLIDLYDTKPPKKETTATAPPKGSKKIDLSNYDIPKGAKVVYSKDGATVLGYELNGQKFKF